MSSSWFFVKDGQRSGPMRREELDARIAEGVVDGDTLVWRPGMHDWTKACAVPELGLPPPVPPPPLPAPPLPVFVSPAPVVASSAPADSPAGSRDLVFAGFRVRLAAKLIDGAVLYVIGLLVERAVVALAFDGMMPMAPDWAGLWRLFMISGTINTAIAVAYTVYFMARYEATPGKRLLGLRVVRADGSRLGAGRVIGRYFAETLSTITFFAGYVMAAFDEEKRTLHDYLCDTRVVRGPREDRG
jgi:Predicted membrane protein/domain